MKKRLLAFGNGSFDLNGRARDGSVYTRRGLVKWCNENNIEYCWLGKDRDENHDDLQKTINYADVIGKKKGPFEFEEPLPKGDFLLIEARTRIFGPYDIGYEQGKIINWYLKNTDIMIGVWDFDLNIQNIFGKNGKKGLYPWLENYMDRFVGLVPYEVTDEILNKHNLKNLKTLYWPMNHEIVLDPGNKSRLLLYSGSDYHRREKFAKFYGEVSNITNSEVAYSGVWKKKDSKEFLAQFPNLKHTGYVTLDNLRKEISNSYGVVQIVRKDYEAIGYHTERLQEVPFFGAVCLADGGIKNIEKFCLPDLIVNTTQETLEKLAFISRLLPRAYKELVIEQQRYLLNNHHTYQTGYELLKTYI